MQFDRTFIEIRERGTLEVVDLSLRVGWAWRGPLIKLWLIGVTPFLVINYFLLGWLLNDVEFGDGFAATDLQRIFRYVWNTVFLVFIQAPLATALMTLYLGKTAFTEGVTLESVFADFKELAGRFLRCQLVNRAILLPMVLLVFAIGESSYSAVEFWVLFLALITSLVRMSRPFLSEIVLLERNPLRSDGDPNTVPISKRNQAFHSNDVNFIMMHAIISMVVWAYLVFAIYGTVMFCSGVFLNQWVAGRLVLLVVFPLCLWSAFGILTIVRFLSYLDLRIRQEGWEVELQLRAEANRLQNRWSYG